MVLFTLAVVSFGVFSCQKTIDQTMDRDEVNARFDVPAECAGPYNITLVGKVKTDNGWMWTWRIVNPNPGNGSDGTVQGLSHFNLLVPNCEPDELTLLSAAYSTNGDNWTNNPIKIEGDNSIEKDCPELNTPSLKYNVGGDYYFRLEIAEDYQPGLMYGYYKSGNNTSCGKTCFEGISCVRDNPRPPQGCSFSQGFWFAKPISEANAWPDDFMMGGKSYTQAEGKALFFVSGNNELKRAFTQAATIKLSIATGYLTDPSGIIAAVNNVETVLSGLPKLTPANIGSVNKGLTAATRKSLSNWAGAIGKYVDANHCEINPGY